MQKALLVLFVLVIGLAPALAGAQTPGMSDKSAPSSSPSSDSPGGSGTSTPGASSPSPSASPTTSPSTGAPTDLSQHKTQIDCERAGGDWQSSTRLCQKKAE